jgi:predicted acylesterase/phospholipase RssA
MVKTIKKTVSLVLGSGGARGLAHIGIIHWLEENNYEIRSIVGCSIGAVIGGIYAAGKIDVYEEWMRSITKIDIVTLSTGSFMGKERTSKRRQTHQHPYQSSRRAINRRSPLCIYGCCDRFKRPQGNMDKVW